MSDKEIRKSKTIVSMVPKTALTKSEDVMYHFILHKFGKEFWDYDNHKLIQDTDLVFSFNASDVWNEISKDKGNTFKQLNNAFENLSSLAYKFKKTKRVTYTPVFSKIDFDDQGAVIVKMNSDFIKHVVEVKQDFVSISMNQIQTFTSRYSRAIYDLIKTHIAKDLNINVNIPIETIREHTHTKSKYKIWDNFKKRVIIPIENDLKSSDLQVSFTPLSKGLTRAITHINIKGKLNKEYDPNKDPSQLSLDDGWELEL